MKMIRAVIRPEAVDKVADSLETGGFTALTRIEVFGRGKQKGIKVGNVVYDNLPKTMIMLVVDDDSVEKSVKIIEDSETRSGCSSRAGDASCQFISTGIGTHRQIDSAIDHRLRQC